MEAFEQLRAIAKEIDRVGVNEAQSYLVITADNITGEALATYSSNPALLSSILTAFFRENPELFLDIQEEITTIGLYRTTNC